MFAVLRHPGSPASSLIWIYAIGMLAFMAMNGVLSLYLGKSYGVTEETIGGGDRLNCAGSCGSPAGPVTCRIIP